MSIDLIGWVAVALTQVFWIPNITRILRTRDVQGHSLSAWLLMLTGLGCWLIYFAARGDTVGIAANISGVTGATITVALIWFWRRSPRSAATPSLEMIRPEPLPAGEMPTALPPTAPPAVPSALPGG
ncbi:MAG: SemiSWEET family sugar transporter [Dehalococcoidia bacterium]